MRHGFDLSPNFKAEAAEAGGHHCAVWDPLVQARQDCVCISVVLGPLMNTKYLKSDQYVLRFVIMFSWEQAVELLLLITDITEGCIRLTRVISLKSLIGPAFFIAWVGIGYSEHLIQFDQSSLLVPAI